jgi:hypothetical protein
MNLTRVLLALNLIAILAVGIAPSAYAKARELMGAPQVEKHSRIKLPKDRVEVDRVQFTDGLDCVAFSKTQKYNSYGVTTGVSGTCNWDTAGTR